MIAKVDIWYYRKALEEHVGWCASRYVLAEQDKGSISEVRLQEIAKMEDLANDELAFLDFLSDEEATNTLEISLSTEDYHKIFLG